MRRGTDHRPGKEAVSRTLILRLTDAAEADLAELWSHIARQASEGSATRFLMVLSSRFTQVQHFPAAGAPRGQLAPGLRVIFHQDYAIYYTSTETEAVIVRVLHGARDAAIVAARGGFEGRET